MISRRPINFLKAAHSFRYAWQGIVTLLRFENNARIHFFATLISVALGFVVELSVLEWVVIVVVIGLVWAAEAFNTAIEKLADIVSPALHPGIKEVKDLAAAGVLLLSAVAVVVALLVFLPKIIFLLSV